MKNRYSSRTRFGILAAIGLFSFPLLSLAQPVNDNCANAILLPVTSSCSKVWGTVVGATPSGVTSTCGGTNGYDVWYKFVAVTTNATVNLNDYGANYTNRRLQVFSGACGGLTSVDCESTGGPPLSAGPFATTVGNTYYIRVFSTTVTAPTTAGDFSVCVTTTGTIPPRWGNSYVNLTKKTTGGVVQKGDVLEIRMTINHTSGTLYRPRYLDNIPTNTQMVVADGIKIITNEGYTFRQYTATDGSNDDAGTYRSAPPMGHYNIRLNLGLGASPPGSPATNSETDLTGTGGLLVAAGAANKPRGGGGMLFATAFRVVVTGDPGQIIQFGAGKFIYRPNSATDPDITINTTPFQILISDPLSLCSNATGVNNAEEFGGTFGSGNTLNRSTNLTFPIPGYTFVNASANQGVGDGQYAIVKNISPRSGTNRTAERTPTCPTALPSQNSCGNRMHNGHWDIDGDHTGTNNAIGNLPPSDPTPGGYMLMVNADYVASETYKQTIENLCPNTYYEFSAWVRNICPTCGIDSTGASYLPRRPGVYPNLTFALDNVDRYSTGEIDVTGWSKRGFMFVTGPGQTTATFSIRNNSQGGGGNDWVLDDITVATCLPNMNYSPSLTPTICEGNSLTISNTIRSFFSNYTHHQWQRSTDGGVTWTNLGPALNGTPVFNAGLNAWEYVTTYTIPPANTNVANNNDRYRVIVATTNDNLSSLNCQVTDGISIITVNVIDCTPTLQTDLLGFNAKLIGANAHLSWTSSKEEPGIGYTIEKSTDGRNFQAIGTVDGANNGASTNHYTYIDAEQLTDKAWYRVMMTAGTGKKKYTATIQLKKDMPDFDFVKVINPFTNAVEFDISSSTTATITIDLVDITGKAVRSEKQRVYAGVTSLQLADTQSLPAGVYTLRIVNHDKVLVKRIMKKN